MTDLTLNNDTELAWEGGRVRADDGTSIAYVAIGRGPLVVVVHGGLGQGAQWAPIARALADNYRVVLIDRRSSGNSGWSDDVGVEVEARDVLAVLDAVGPAAALVGHSYGAAVALHAAVAGGDRIGRLVLYEPPLAVGGPLIDEATLTRWRDLAACGQYVRVLSEFQAPPVSALNSITPQELAMFHALPDWEMRWAAMVALAPVVEPSVRSVNALTDAGRYRAITAPALLLLGSESAEHPFKDTTGALQQAIPNASVRILDGQRHAATFLAPALLVDSIRSFVPTP